ncbi:capsule assembly Wzi family protein [Catalinimonas alkaloidigena]|uniref:capsule assembly Wzi family protein n=1 Tax=Catalinimonas alkaloidigena TaxID=1075417 RepID=UPI0015A0F1C0|nr:capsule assembly Wzi family protein [Catalinimonas alkaloidigena]
MSGRTLWGLLIFLQGTVAASAQGLDSLQITLGAVGTVAAQPYQPLWLVSNQFGALADQGMDLATHVRLSNAHVDVEYNTQGDLIDPRTGLIQVTPPRKGLYLNYGLDVYNHRSFGRTFVQEAFAKAGYRHWEVRVGAFEDVREEVDPVLSSGSLGISGNAQPIPQVGLAVTEFTPVPFTGGWLQFKGGMSHGWLGRQRWYQHSYLHEKHALLQIGKRRFRLFGGFHHYAIWGGRRSEQAPADRSTREFARIVLLRRGTGADQRAVVEGGLSYETAWGMLRLYHQTPYELSVATRLLNLDQVTGVSFVPRYADAVLQRLVVEVIYTNYLQGERYYNDYKYATGWEYQQRVIGAPLLTNRIRAHHYFPAIVPFSWENTSGGVPGNDNIVNTRVAGGHLGVVYRLGALFTGKTVLTLVQNYGNNPRSPFYQKMQSYNLQEITYCSPHSGFSVSGAIGFDGGELTDNLGVRLSVQQQIRPFR